MTYNAIRFSVEDAIATISLNRPDRLNACTVEMIDEVADALDNLDGARAVILTGEGRAFCSGADLQGGSEGSGTPGDSIYRALSRHYNATLLKIARLNVPVICAVNGPAAGMGCSIGLWGDLVIASESAFFVQAFVNVGLVPDGGATWMLPRLIGRARAYEMMLLGERVYGPQAVEWGMIYKCVPDDALMDEARKVAEKLAKGPTAAIATIRRGVSAALESDLSSAIIAEAEAQRAAFDSHDGQEGKNAFVEKRSPVFLGR